jgi:hypothetical protein
MPSEGKEDIIPLTHDFEVGLFGGLKREGGFGPRFLGGTLKGGANEHPENTVS